MPICEDQRNEQSDDASCDDIGRSMDSCSDSAESHDQAEDKKWYAYPYESSIFFHNSSKQSSHSDRHRHCRVVRREAARRKEIVEDRFSLIVYQSQSSVRSDLIYEILDQHIDYGSHEDRKSYRQSRNLVI